MFNLNHITLVAAYIAAMRVKYNVVDMPKDDAGKMDLISQCGDDFMIYLQSIGVKYNIENTAKIKANSHLN
jgi:hypothetical protein